MRGLFDAGPATLTIAEVSRGNGETGLASHYRTIVVGW
jgi:hypothetical protein